MDGDRTSFDVVLLDIETPVMNGPQCIAETRRLEAAGRITRHIPVSVRWLRMRGKSSSIGFGRRAWMMLSRIL